MRRCSRCKQEKPFEAFNFKIKQLGLRQYTCRDCTRLQIRNHYISNRIYYLNKAKKRNSKLRQKAYKYIGEFLSTHGCVDCGEKDILVLEFDHKDRAKKSFEINKILRARLTFKKLIEEISKCDVRCANCHRRKTERENKSWRLIYNLPL